MSRKMGKPKMTWIEVVTLDLKKCTLSMDFGTRYNAMPEKKNSANVVRTRL